MKHDNVYYFSHINKLGGIETFFYELAKKYSDYDLVIVYKSGDLKQINRLRKYVRVVKYNGETIKCKKAFFNFNTDIIDNVEAEEYNLIVHGNYKFLPKGIVPVHKKINNYYAVSKDSAKAFTEITGIKCDVVYNPLTIDEVKPIIHLVCASRLNDKVKGSSRVKELIKALDTYAEENNRQYTMTLFTDEKDTGISRNINYKEPRLDIRPYLNDADYVVQLSDNLEGFNYTVNEALRYNTPVVITPCDVYKELGIDETMSITLNFDLSNINEVVEKIFKGIKWNFEYKNPIDGWDKLLIKGKSKYREEMNMKYKVKALETFTNVTDKEVGRTRELGEEWIVTKERLDILLGENERHIIYVENLGEVKEEVKKETKTTTKKTTKTKKATK